MAERPDTPDPRALAIAWWCSRSSILDGDGAVDLETLDQWRQGRLSPQRAADVKRQLGDDPRLMRMLEELIAADDVLQRWEAEAQTPAQPFSAWPPLRQVVDQVRSRLRDPIWAGGLVVATASLVLVALLPILIPLNVDRRLD
jgi:anti-sigma factor RsiW